MRSIAIYQQHQDQDIKNSPFAAEILAANTVRLESQVKAQKNSVDKSSK